MERIKKVIQQLEKSKPTESKNRLAKLVALDGIYKTLTALAWIKLQCQNNAAEKRAFKKEMQLWKAKIGELELPLIMAKMAYNLDVLHAQNVEISKKEGLRVGGYVPQKHNDSPFVNESENVMPCTTC